MNINNTPLDGAALGEGATILIVEDEFLIRIMLSENLIELGYNVLEACNADEALGVLVQSAPELVVTDIRMPGTMDGLGLHARIRNTHPALPIIIVSAHTDYLATLDEQTQFIPKPYPFDMLSEVVRHTLQPKAT